MTKHSQPTDCLKFLEETNSASEKKIIARFGNVLEHGCLDEYLNIFTSRIRTEEVHSICIYLRSYRIFDQADQDRIFNDSVFNTPERKATELLTEVGKRGHHAYWFLAHALKSLGTKQMPLFNFFHGKDFRCCVCKDIELREKQEQLEFLDLDGDVTAAIVSSVVSVMRAFKAMVEEKCTTAKEAVRKRSEERMRNKHPNKGSDIEQVAHPQDVVEDDLESYHEDNSNNEDLAGEVKALETALSRVFKAFKVKVGKKCSDAKQAVQRNRRRSSPTTYSEENDKTRHKTKEGYLAGDSVVSKERFYNVIRRKQVYKAAFITLSVITLFSLASTHFRYLTSFLCITIAAS